jgi:hypothetical protein
MLTVRQVPAVVAAPAALTAPSPGRLRRPTRVGDHQDQWGRRPRPPTDLDCHHRYSRAVPRVADGKPGARASTPESRARGSDVLSPPAAGRSPAVTIGA